MFIHNLLKKNHMSIYRFAKESGIPYASAYDIVHGKARPEKCTAETVCKIAHTLHVSVEDLLAPYLAERPDFENYKSTVCHRVKDQGDIGFLLNTLKDDSIRKYFDWGWYPEALYLLAMTDYLSRLNDIPACEDYDDLRKCKLEEVIYPAGIMVYVTATNDASILDEIYKDAIPEFKRFNIIENEVRNVA